MGVLLTTPHLDRSRLGPFRRESEFSALYRVQHSMCFYCRQAFLPMLMTRDHFIPKIEGGAEGWENIVLACCPCNHRKGSALPTVEQARRFRELQEKVRASTRRAVTAAPSMKGTEANGSEGDTGITRRPN